MSLIDDRPESSIDETDRSLQETATDFGIECFVEEGNEPISSAAFMILLYFKGEMAAFWLFPFVSGTSETYFSKSFRAIIITFFLGEGGGDFPRRGYFGAVSSLLLISPLDRVENCNGDVVTSSSDAKDKPRSWWSDSACSSFFDGDGMLIFITSQQDESSTGSDNKSAASLISLVNDRVVSLYGLIFSSSFSHRRTGFRGE